MCANRQKEILEIARRLVATDGKLVYSTCTFAPAEDEEIVGTVVFYFDDDAKSFTCKKSDLLKLFNKLQESFNNKYDVDVNQSMNRANQRIQASALNAFEDTVEGYDSVSPIQAAMQVANGSYKYALYPVWILNVKWNGKNHTFAMNGQTGKFVGNIPTEEKKAKLIGGLGGAAVGALIYIIANIISSL